MSGASADSTWTRCPAQPAVFGRAPRERSQHPFDPRTRATRVAHALRVQPAQHGREHHVQTQNDHRPRYAKSSLRRTVSRGAVGEQDPQHNDNDPSRDVGQLPSGVIPARGTGDLSFSSGRGRVARAVARPSPLRSEQGDFHHSALPLRSLTEPSPRSERRSGMVGAGAP